jgi:hypothetical protein
MLEMFEATEAQCEFLESVGLVPKFREFSYFLAAHTTDWDAMNRDGGFLGSFAPPRHLPAFPEAIQIRPKTPTRRP